MIHLICGTMYCWGNLVSYLPPSLKYFGSSEGKMQPDAVRVLPLILVSQMCGMPFGPVLEKFMGPRLTAILGALMMASGVFLASFAKTLKMFILSYSVLFGTGVGIAYQMPFITGGRWFPASKGMVTGAIISGMGAAALIFNIIATKIINPDNLDAVGGIFPAEVYARFSGLLRTLSVIYLVVAVTGALLQNNPKSNSPTYPLFEMLKGNKVAAAPQKVVAAPAAPKSSLASNVLSKQFALMWLTILFVATPGLAIAGQYKIYGLKQPNLNSDSFLALVGQLSAIFGNAAGRFIWGALSDAFGFKRPFLTLTVIEALCMLSFQRLASNRLTFAIATIAMHFCMGGAFAMFPAQTMRSYGAAGASVYSIMFTGFGTAALFGADLSNFLLAKGGYALIYRVLGAFAMVATGLTFLWA